MRGDAARLRRGFRGSSSAKVLRSTGLTGVVLAACFSLALLPTAALRASEPGTQEPATERPTAPEQTEKHHADAMDTERECEELTPAAIGRSGVTDDGDPVNLDVAVLLDGVSINRATAVFGRVNRAYTPLDVRIVPTFEEVSLVGQDADFLLDQAKAHFNGTRPPGSDVVYVLTRKDIKLSSSSVELEPVGLADCIGGVRYPDRAFAIGEDFAGENMRFGPLREYVFATAKVAAHEIAHLLGAHHHYANCLEGIPSETDRSEASACTLLFNSLRQASLAFSTVNGAVVRGHATQYAKP